MLKKITNFPFIVALWKFNVLWKYCVFLLMHTQGELVLPLSTTADVQEIPKGVKKTQELYMDTDPSKLKLNNTL